MKYYLVLLLTALMFFTSCDEDDKLSEEEKEKKEQEELLKEVNAWIYEVMDEIYLWEEHLPKEITDNTQDPEDYFESILYKDEDRFSVIVSDYNELISSLNGVTKEGGYEFRLVGGANNAVYAIVLYVKENSPAASAGLKRGEVITAINDVAMTETNYQNVLEKLDENHTLSIATVNNSGNLSSKGTISINVVEYSENPIFMYKVITKDTKKIGYLVYNFFSNGEAGDNYDAAVDAVFADFKAKGVNELILDLRYNSGGSIKSATNLASLIAPNVGIADVFYMNQFNDLLTAYYKQEGEDTNGYFLSKADNIGGSLSKIYVLCGRYTASASELVINGLKPYMDVELIGMTTYGKNVGSVPVDDPDNEDNKYGMLPIILKISNSEGFSDYGKGFTPDVEINELETKYMPLKPLGDESEPLLAQAIATIVGLPARTLPSAAGEAFEAITDQPLSPYKGHLIVD